MNTLKSEANRADPRRAIRAEMRRRRRALPSHERRARDQAITRLLGGSGPFLRADHIAFYLTNDGEVDLAPLIRRAWAMGKRCYLPVLGPVHHNRLWFARYEPDSRMVRNRFGIPEPETNWTHVRRPWSLDLVLTPLVAFDDHGNRLGMGGGYYDRTLAYLDHRNHWRKPELLGVAYSVQRHEALPTEPWDVPLHGVVTDEGLWLGDRRG